MDEEGGKIYNWGMRWGVLLVVGALVSVGLYLGDILD
jgi:hypothetical protein